MTYAERIESKVKAAFAPITFTLVDDSHRHAGHSDRIAALKTPGEANGHAPIDGQGETHFSLTIVSDAFTGKSRVARQRMVYDVLKDELAERIHALALKTLSPDEVA
jgi:BolA protein